MQKDPGKDAPTQKKSRRKREPYKRTGCLTCKIRHLKCDEQRPSCHRCVSTGRKCDGYAFNAALSTLAQEPKNLVETHENALPSAARLEGTLMMNLAHTFEGIPGTEREQRSWVHFCRQTAPILAIYSDSDFWNRLLLQMGRSEPVLRHAMIALSVVHECMTKLGNLPVNSADMQVESDYHFALKNYNQSIGHLRTLSNSGRSSVEITLMVCILFVCLEFLQHNQQNALRHVHNGLQILGSLEDHDNGEDINRVQLQSPSRFIDNQVAHIMLRLATQCQFLGLEYGYPLKSLAEPTPMFGPLTFTTLLQAREAMDRLTDETLRIVFEIDRVKYDPLPDPIYLTKQLDGLKELDWWLFSFETFLHSSKAMMNPQQAEAIKMMRIHQKISKIWLSTALSPLETSFDSHLSDFRAVIALAESIDQSPTTRGTFSYEIGIYPPVHFVAIKCRHPALRRRAIKILSSQRRQESHWHSHQMASLAARIMAIEEAEIPAGVEIDQYGPGNISDGVRVRDTHTDPPLYNPPRSHVIFKTKPDGPYGELIKWGEDILWEPVQE